MKTRTRGTQLPHHHPNAVARRIPITQRAALRRLQVSLPR